MRILELGLPRRLRKTTAQPNLPPPLLSVRPYRSGARQQFRLARYVFRSLPGTLLRPGVTEGGGEPTMRQIPSRCPVLAAVSVLLPTGGARLPHGTAVQRRLAPARPY